jgi:hypothetical protein
MTADEFEANIMTPGIAFMQQQAPQVPWQRNAHVLALAIAGQESDWSARVQSGNGPAHSFWQFEQGGGVRGVINHPTSGPIITTICAAVPVACEEHAVWEIMGQAAGDNLSLCMARLLLFTDPAPIPPPDDEEATWQYYLRNWRPGQPNRQRWSARIQEANLAVGPSPTS